MDTTRKVSEMKNCTKCKASKDLAEFGNRKASKDGLQLSCKACLNASRAAWKKANPEKNAASRAAWRKANPEKEIAKRHRRRAREASNGVNLVTATETAAIIAQPCMACDAPAPSTVEHLIPINRGGAHTIGNLAPLCKPCNSSKNDMTWTEWKYSNRAQAKKAFGR